MTLEEHVQRVGDVWLHGAPGALPGARCCGTAGVCLARQYCAYAGIVRGQKTHDFFGRLVARRLATPYAVRAPAGARLSPPSQGALPGDWRARHRLRRPTSGPRGRAADGPRPPLAHPEHHLAGDRAREGRALPRRPGLQPRTNCPSITFDGQHEHRRRGTSRTGCRSGCRTDESGTSSSSSPTQEVPARLPRLSSTGMPSCSGRLGVAHAAARATAPGETRAALRAGVSRGVGDSRCGPTWSTSCAGTSSSCGSGVTGPADRGSRRRVATSAARDSGRSTAPGSVRGERALSRRDVAPAGRRDRAR